MSHGAKQNGLKTIFFAIWTGSEFRCFARQSECCPLVRWMWSWFPNCDQQPGFSWIRPNRTERVIQWIGRWIVWILGQKMMIKWATLNVACFFDSNLEYRRNEVFIMKLINVYLLSRSYCQPFPRLKLTPSPVSNAGSKRLIQEINREIVQNTKRNNLIKREREREVLEWQAACKSADENCDSHARLRQRSPPNFGPRSIAWCKLQASWFSMKLATLKLRKRLEWPRKVILSYYIVWRWEALKSVQNEQIWLLDPPTVSHVPRTPPQSIRKTITKTD